MTAQCAWEEGVKAVRRDREHLARAAKAHPVSKGRKKAALPQYSQE